MTDLERLAKITQRDRELNSFAFRSFRDVADADYIAARMAHRAQLPVQFVWASQQAIEKYLKCILFIRRVPASRVRHNLSAALKLIESEQIPLALTARARQFIESIDSVGQYRYMEASLFVEWPRVVVLDQTVWELRRFSTLDPKSTSLVLMDGEWAPRMHIPNGEIERILKNRKNRAREPLLWHNGFFGRGRRKVTVRGGFTAVNSPLVRMSDDMIGELRKLVFIPDPVANVYLQSVRSKAGQAAKS